jgi:hypothetical protein
MTPANLDTSANRVLHLLNDDRKLATALNMQANELRRARQASGNTRPVTTMALRRTASNA